MGGASGTVALVLIVAIGIFFLFILPRGLTGMTTSVVSDNGIVFENHSPLEKVKIFGDCYEIKLQVNYHLSCSLCNPKDITEYFWLQNSKNNYFDFYKGDRKTIHSGKEYTAEMKVNVCKGNSYKWFMCIDDVKLKCAGNKDNPFMFSVE